MSGEWFHASRTTIKRSEGRSVVAAAAYRTAMSIECEREGIVHDYTRKGGVLVRFVATPEGKAGLEWAQDISALTNAMEAAEKRKDAQVGHEWTIALPSVLDGEQRSALSHELAQRLSDLYGVAVISAVHAPGREGDDRNDHLHLLFTTRQVEPGGQLGAKVTSITDRKTSAAEVSRYRQVVADTINAALEDAGFDADEKVDHRSFAERGITDRAPTRHNGPSVTAYRRRGVETEREADNLAVIEERIAEQEKLAQALCGQPDDMPPAELSLEAARELARRFGEEWRETPLDVSAMPLPASAEGWQEVQPFGDMREALQPEIDRLEATGGTHWPRAALSLMRGLTDAFLDLLRDESGAAPLEDDPEPPEGRGWMARAMGAGRKLWSAYSHHDGGELVDGVKDAAALIRDLAVHEAAPPDMPHRETASPAADVDAAAADGAPQPDTEATLAPVAPEDPSDGWAALWAEDLEDTGGEWPPGDEAPEPDAVPEPDDGPDIEP